MADKTYAKFDELPAEEEGAGKAQLGPKEFSSHLKFLEGKLSAEDYASAMTQLGLSKTELSNEDLLSEIKSLLDGAKAPMDEEEDPEKKKPVDSAINEIATDMGVSADEIKSALANLVKPDEEEKKPEDDEKEMAAPDYKEFIQSEMKKGATLAEATAKWKEKYPEPDEKDEAELQRLLSLETRLAKLEGEKNAAELGHKVDSLVRDKHLSPKQAVPIKQLASGLAVEEQDKLLDFFRDTQKFNVHTDVGEAPGTESPLDEETRSIILEKHGLAQLIREKGVRKEYSFMKKGVDN